MISPLHHLNTDYGPKDRDQSIELYVKAIRQIASKRNYRFVNLFNPGVKWAFENSDQFKIIEDPDFKIEIDTNRKDFALKVENSNSKVNESVQKNENSAPKINEPDRYYRNYSDDGVHLDERGYEHVSCLICDALGAKAENYSTKEAYLAAAKQAEKLRIAVVEKSRLWFHRWRAKASEGDTGNDRFPAETADLDRLIGEKEKEIFELAKPVPHTYELVPEK